MKQTDEDRVKEIIRRVDLLKSERATWESHWEEVAEFVAPGKGGIIKEYIPGGKRMERVFDCTAIDANDVFAAGMFSHLCNGRWFILKPSNPNSDQRDEVNWWFAEATRILHEELAVSNFGQMVHEHFRDLGCFGTGNIYEDEGKPGGPSLNFRNIHIASYYVCENSQGLIDTIYRKILYTARQAVQEWGLENVGDSVRAAYNNENKKDEKFDFIHAVFPREERDERKKDKLNMPFASIYIDVKNKKIISESGYNEMPFLVDRLDKESSEIYGRSPAMKMLPEIKLLNKMVKTIIKAAEKVVDPPLQVPDDGFISPFKTTPGGIMYYKTGSQDRIVPLDTKADIGLGLEMENQRRESINRAFFVDLFLLLAEKKNMTATEVLERVEEKLLLLGPMLGRLQSELFNPLIDRSMGILFRAGKLPPIPDGVNAYDIEYIGKLSIAMKMLEVKAVTGTIAYIAPLVESNPALMDNFNDDKIVRGVSDRMGMPADWLRTEEEIAQIRNMRAQQMQAQQQLEAGKGIADMVPKLSGKVEEDSPLSLLAGGMG